MGKESLDWILDIIEKKGIPYPYDLIRMFEVLNDYWISEPDEEEVKVLMKFKHHDGQSQEKEFIWRNPKYAKPIDTEDITLLSALDILNAPCRCEWCGQFIHPDFDVNE